LFVDSDQDGVLNPSANDKVYPNMNVELITPDGTVVGTTTSDPNGQYSFGDLPPGDYQVRVPDLDPDLEVVTTGANSDDVGPTGTSGVINVAPGENKISDAGVAQYVIVKGTVWKDGNGDGIRNATEVPVGAGYFVQVYTPDKGVIEKGRTDENGQYEVKVPVNGQDYTVEYAKPQGTTFVTTPTADNDVVATTTSAGTKGVTAPFPVAYGPAIIKDAAVVPGAPQVGCVSDDSGASNKQGTKCTQQKVGLFTFDNYNRRGLRGAKVQVEVEDEMKQ